MTDYERQLLLETVQDLKRLSRERDDMIVATAAITLDLYRRGFASGDQTREEALAHLRVQLVRIEGHPP